MKSYEEYLKLLDKKQDEIWKKQDEISELVHEALMELDTDSKMEFCRKLYWGFALINEDSDIDWCSADLPFGIKDKISKYAGSLIYTAKCCGCWQTFEQAFSTIEEYDRDIDIFGVASGGYVEDVCPECKKNILHNKGFVYLLQSPTGYYKIGRTSDPENRMKTFGIQLPFEVEYICIIKTLNMYALEKNLHQYFSEKRVNGEWFQLLSEDIEYVKGLSK